MPPLRLLAVPLFGTLLGACASSSAVPVQRSPDASLLLPCERPQATGVNPTDNEVALAWLDAVQKYLACERRHADLVRFVGGAP